MMHTVHRVASGAIRIGVESVHMAHRAALAAPSWGAGVMTGSPPPVISEAGWRSGTEVEAMVRFDGYCT